MSNLPDSWFISDPPLIAAEDNVHCVAMSLFGGDVVCVGKAPKDGEWGISREKLKRIVLHDCMDQIQATLDGKRKPHGKENLIRQALEGEITRLIPPNTKDNGEQP